MPAPTWSSAIPWWCGHPPRFLSVGDQSRFFMQIDNVEGPAGDYTINLDINGADRGCGRRAAQPREAGGQRTRNRDSSHRGGRIGTATVDTTVTGAGFEAGQRFSLRIQPGSSSLVRRVVRPLPNGESLTVSADLLADILPGTGAVSVSIAARRPRRAGPSPGARPLSLRLHRADREPRPAASM